MLIYVVTKDMVNRQEPFAKNLFSPPPPLLLLGPGEKYILAN
jgi:hypothetical protein